jgi:FMN phosphatase YigB (HAD superfamily)
MDNHQSMTEGSKQKPTVLFDIDGTLANIEHRRQLVQREKPDWKSFNAQMGDDAPNWPIVSLYRSLWNACEYDLILVTGRNEVYRKVTEQWLAWNEIPFGDMYMRADNDFRSDHVIKEEILSRLQSLGKQILFVVDDRQQVVDMWRHNGITVLQCDVGNF